MPPDILPLLPNQTPSEDDIRAQEWSELYKEALNSTGSEESCVAFKILANTPDFPLFWGALWRQLEHCPTPPAEELRQIAKIISDVPKYWQLPFKRVLIHHYQLLDMRLEWVETLITLNELSTNKSEKENYLLTALNLAPEEDKPKILELLQAIAPRFIQDPEEKELYKVARDFEDAMEFEESRKIYRQIIEDPKRSIEEKIKCWDRLSLNDKKALGKEEFAKILAERGKWLQHNLPSPESDNSIAILYDAQVEEARAWWTVEENKKAKKLLRTMLDAYNPQTTSEQVTKILSSASWVMAMIHAEEKKHKLAREYFALTQQLYEKNNNKNFESIMSMSKYYYIQKKKDIAADLFSMAALSAYEEYQKEIALFWHGLVLSESGQKEKALETLKPLALTDRWGLYGHLARNLIKILDPNDLTNYPNPTNLNEKVLPESKQVSKQESKQENKQKNKPDSTLAWLGHLEEEELAELYLDSNWKSPIDALERCREVGLHHRTLHYYFKLPEKKRLLYMQQDPFMAYPFPWKELIETHAKKHNVPVSLILAIIRQESQFKPNARSPADAFGLMQLIPETARRVAKSQKIDFDKAELLYRPEINIALGVAYISELLREFNNSMPLAIASYNAGKAAVKKWLSIKANTIPAKARFPQLVFSEAIPYKETKNYVSKVMRNYINYCSLIENRDCSNELITQYGKKAWP